MSTSTLSSRSPGRPKNDLAPTGGGSGGFSEPGAQLTHQPRAASPATQGSLPRRYPVWVQALSMAAFTLAFVGWLNETWLFWFDNPIWLNRYDERDSVVETHLPLRVGGC